MNLTHLLHKSPDLHQFVADVCFTHTVCEVQFRSAYIVHIAPQGTITLSSPPYIEY